MPYQIITLFALYQLLPICSFLPKLRLTILRDTGKTRIDTDAWRDREKTAIMMAIGPVDTPVKRFGHNLIATRHPLKGHKK
ncbi:hypothetical protein TH25_15150 [Thalassospira profundimaris]|uniref:Uncharacterized protein n=1 Tax=Thalassospira profundimaris TaxID=502049 RepID=A0A367X1S1_9PROT|nr:hypothetical protein TH25_15150 [Thalassospira profundimaris]